MIEVFIDDSGTAPDQKVAIASALIIESRRIARLNQEVTALARQEGFLSDANSPDFHTSECVSGNHKSVFAAWDESKKNRVCAGMRRIAKQYGVNACSIAITKSDYDALVPIGSELRTQGGKFHYTWAVRELIRQIERWRLSQGLTSPMSYVFDCMGSDAKNIRKKEVESVMRKAELRNPGHYADRYVFGRRNQIPALQCADILAWTCYRFALSVLKGDPLNEIARTGFWDFQNYKPSGGDWLLAIVQTRAQLQGWVERQSS